jgi:hypothetical protein
MSTVDKCCQITQELGEVFEQIKANNTTTIEKDKANSTMKQHDKKKILKLFNY